MRIDFRFGRRALLGILAASTAGFAAAAEFKADAAASPYAMKITLGAVSAPNPTVPLDAPAALPEALVPAAIPATVTPDAEASSERPALKERLSDGLDKVRDFHAEVVNNVIGQRAVIDLSLVALLVKNGHSLFEGVSGLGKTTLADAIGVASGLKPQKIQFKADTQPSDITGYEESEKDPVTGEPMTHRGPLLNGQFILADELNRAPERTKSGLLEAMQSGMVTIGKTSHPLPENYHVMATMNPPHYKGTYPMTEAELDRFLVSADMDYPETRNEEKFIGRLISNPLRKKPQKQVLDDETIQALQRDIALIPIDEAIEDYIVNLVWATRPGKTEIDLKGNVAQGSSPRATGAMYQVSRVYAFLADRAYVNVDDVQKAARVVLRHRIMMDHKAKYNDMTRMEIIRQIINEVPLPKS